MNTPPSTACDVETVVVHRYPAAKPKYDELVLTYTAAGHVLLQRLHMRGTIAKPIDVFESDNGFNDPLRVVVAWAYPPKPSLERLGS